MITGFLTRISAVFVCATWGLAGPAFATQVMETRVEAVAKINQSGRQRMLVQRMAKAACFAYIGVDVQGHLEMAKGAMTEFDQTLVALRLGDPIKHLTPESDTEILAELAAVEQLWTEFKPLITALAEPIEAASIQSIAALNVPLLVQMNTAVLAFEAKYATEAIHPELAGAVNIAGRQRMLSQKASKEFCMIIGGIDTAIHQADLKKTMALFDTSLTRLQTGDSDAKLLPPVSDEQAWQYERVQEIWNEFAPLVAQATSSTSLSADVVARVARDNNTLLIEMDAAVQMY